MKIDKEVMYARTWRDCDQNFLMACFEHDGGTAVLDEVSERLFDEEGKSGGNDLEILNEVGGPDVEMRQIDVETSCVYFQ